MTITSGFFNSVNHDRTYDAEQISSIFDGIIKDGVYESIGDAFMVTPNSDLNDSVIVGTGRAWFDHTWTLNDAQFSLTLDEPNTLYGRIDYVVIDVNREQDVRKNTLKIVRGTMSDNPQEPVLINTDRHKQYPIAKIDVPAGASRKISASDITYLVGTEKCPLVTGVLEALNITNYFKQYDAEFNEWFEGIKDIFGSADPMTEFANLIEKINNRIDAIVPYTTRTVFDYMVSGEEPFSVSTFDIPVDGDSAYGSYSPNKIINQILPDGKVSCVDFEYDVSGSSRSVTIRVRLFSNTGALQSTKTLQLESGTKSSSNLVRTPWNIIHVDADSYPVKIVAGYFGAGKALSAVVTITEDGVVSITKSSSNIGTTSYDDYYNSTVRPAKMSDGRTYGVVFREMTGGGGSHVWQLYGVTIDGSGAIHTTSTPIKTASESTSGSNLQYMNWENRGTVCYVANDLIYVEPLAELTSGFNDNKADEQTLFLDSTNITQVKYDLNNSDAAQSLGKPKFAIDPYTFGVVSESPGSVSASYDSMFDLEYSTISDGVMKNYIYENSVVPSSTGQESFKCIDLSNSPNLVSVPYAILESASGSEKVLSGLSQIKSHLSNGTNLVHGAIGSDYSTGLKKTYTVSLGSIDSNQGLTDIYPYSFTIREIGNTLYVAIGAKLVSYRHLWYAYLYDMYEGPIGKIVKIEFLGG